MIAALLRIRNEELIIKDTLDHIAKFAEAIYIYDDASTDNTVEICLQHPSKPQVARGAVWEMKPVNGVALADGRHKEFLLTWAKEDCKPTWFIYLDADERFAGDFRYLLKEDVDALVFELYDFYITPQDLHKEYTGGALEDLRDFCGPEYRLTLMVFRNLPQVFFPLSPLLRCREPWGFDPTRVLYSQEKIKHYGKGISIEQWEKKVSYYSQVRGFTEKWRKRKGKALHTLSDFGAPLLRWEELLSDPNKRGVCLYRYNPALHRKKEQENG